MKKVILATFLIAAACVFAVSTVNATVGGEQNQSQETTTKDTETCEQTGEYGNKKCTKVSETTVKQNQNQKLLADRNIYIGQVKGSRIHSPVNTAVTMDTTVMILAVAVVGFGATYGLAKLK